MKGFKGDQGETGDKGPPGDQGPNVRLFSCTLESAVEKKYASQIAVKKLINRCYDRAIVNLMFHS